MPTISADAANKEYDVIIVGSGAGGGQMAYTLTLAGLKCVMLEAGRNYDPATQSAMFHRPEQTPLLNTPTPDKQMGFTDATVDGGWEIPDEPYTQASDKPEEQFDWWRARMLGGRTNHWGRMSLRNGPYDFKPYSRDGLGFDWPISYDEMAPYYDKVEQLIGVYGTNNGLENTPDSPAGILLPPPKPRVSDALFVHHARKLGIPGIAGHRAVLTQPLDWHTIPAKLHPGNSTAQRLLSQDMQARAPCFWATPCSRGCAI